MLDACHWAIAALTNQREADYITEQARTAMIKTPDKGQVSRARFTMDTVLCLLRRLTTHRVSQTSPDELLYAIWIAWDSSPQFGRDYLVLVVRRALRAHLATMLRHAYKLKLLWLRPDARLHDNELI